MGRLQDISCGCEYANIVLPKLLAIIIVFILMIWFLFF